MTPKQEQKLRNDIKKIKLALAADKKQWGGYYHDGRGLRYEPPNLYIKLNDFTGALRYFNWFNKNFPNDYGFPTFLFEWAVALFKTGRRKEAEKKVRQTFTRNLYVLDKFLGKPFNIDETPGSAGFQIVTHQLNHFTYSNKQENMADFATWLDKLLQTDKFVMFMDKFLEIEQMLKAEKDIEKRKYLIDLKWQLIDE